MGYEGETFASDTFIVRIFWKDANEETLQITLSRIAYTQFLYDVDTGISGALYKVLDSNKRVHRINKYSIRNIVAWETKTGRTASGLRLS